jgi:signal transduction histidine kinase
MNLSDRALRVGSWTLFAFFFAAGWGSLLPLIFNPKSVSDWGSNGALANVGFGVMVTLFPLVGALIIQRQPRNRIGWVLNAIGLSWALTALMDFYSSWALELHPGSLPGGEVVVVVNSSLWLPPILLMGVYLVLLFPDGHVPSPRWRIVAWGSLAVGVFGVLAISLSPGPVDDVAIPLKQNPIGVEALRPLEGAIFGIILPLVPLAVLAAAVATVLRYRRASGVARLQLKWLMAAGSIVAVLFALSMVMSLTNLFRTADGGDNAVATFFQTVSITSFGLIPIAIGIAVTKHKLYDIDALISRALVVGALGVFVTALYVGIVVGVGASIGQRQPSVWLSVVATALVAVLFQPVRERVHRLANRLVYGSRATPYEVLSDFAASMAGRYTTAELLPRMAQTVSECLGGARVEVWLRDGGEMARDVLWPPEPGMEKGAVRVPVEGQSVPVLAADRVVPVRHGEELLGLLVVTKPASEPVTPAEDAMLEHVAPQAGLVLRNVRLVDDLRSSRQRLVTSQDDERRRLERNLHDGAQQSLVSVALLLRMAANYKDPGALSLALNEASTQLQLAIGELRELARGIHPAILTDRGLGPALTSLAERCPVPVHLDNQVSRRLPSQVEGTLYFVAAEALTNVARYSQAPEVNVVVTEEADSVTLEVVDHGVGGANASAGSGLLGLADRVAVVEGAFTVVSPPGEGTRISCRVPVPVAAAPVEVPAPREPVKETVS